MTQDCIATAVRLCRLTGLALLARGHAIVCMASSGCWSTCDVALVPVLLLYSGHEIARDGADVVRSKRNALTFVEAFLIRLSAKPSCLTFTGPMLSSPRKRGAAANRSRALGRLRSHLD
jgi:hypothetical protein